MDLPMRPEMPRIGLGASANDYYCNNRSIIIVYYHKKIITTNIATISQIIIINSIKL